ncbi:helix-turn-helix domain-containing protein [Streptomyces sp. AD55]|uniref:helix-turn-helix domain-containing protein n=1 Tax=Streptomyces sp. AD55 TaxID=3242895 RepID=UPI003526F86E
MSHEAVTWAMDDAPMLLTAKGRPDTTARHVLQVLAEYAHADGTNAYPSLVKIQYRSGYDRTTVRRALRRLETGGLVVAVGTVRDCTNYTLRMDLKRPATDLDDLKAEIQREREAAAERQRRSRARRVTQSAPVTVTDSESSCHASEVRDVTDSASERHGRSAPRTVIDPPSQPPVNPGDGRRPTTGSGGSGAGGSAARQDSEHVSGRDVSAVIRDLPKRLSGMFPEDRPIPAAIERAIRSELARGITARQITSKVRRRYLEWGIERDIESAEGEGVHSPVGALVRLIGPGNCTSPRCDDGTDLDTGEECRSCARDREERRPTAQTPIQGAFLAAVPSSTTPAPIRAATPAPAAPNRMVARDCTDRLCPNSYPAPADAPAGLCPACRENHAEKVSNA